MENEDFRGETLDDLLQQIYRALLASDDVIGASRGTFTEIFGATLVLTNPRARLSRSEMKGRVFSALGELFWYLSGGTEWNFIQYYLKDMYERDSAETSTVRSGYGDRLFNWSGINQVGNVIEALSARPTSRRAVIQLFDADDLAASYKEIPCTCTIQFVLRAGRLNAFVNMRSNDAFKGLPHDIFAFTMLQEMIARALSVELGIYKHCAGSLHLYKNPAGGGLGDWERAEQYVSEGWQAPIAMPQMPPGDPWPGISLVQSLEQRIRNGEDVLEQVETLQPYWRDIAILLIAFAERRRKNHDKVESLKKRLGESSYQMFLDARMLA